MFPLASVPPGRSLFSSKWARVHSSVNEGCYREKGGGEAEGWGGRGATEAPRRPVRVATLFSRQTGGTRTLPMPLIQSLLREGRRCCGSARISSGHLHVLCVRVGGRLAAMARGMLARGTQA